MLQVCCLSYYYSKNNKGVNKIKKYELNGLYAYLCNMCACKIVEQLNLQVKVADSQLLMKMPAFIGAAT